MEINTRKVGNVSIIELKGALVLGDPVEEMQTSTEQLISEGATLIAVNLASVTQMDSSGLGILVRLHTLLKQSGGKLKLYSPPKRVSQVIRMARLDTIFDVAEDESAALSSF